MTDSKKKNGPKTVHIPEFRPEDMPMSCTWMIIGAPGTGKCHGAGTEVIMADGSLKAVENIVQGDLLMGDDSTPRTVLSVTSGVDELYEVIHFRGRSYTVNSCHLLCVKKITKDNVYVEEIIEAKKFFDLIDKSAYRGYINAVDFPTREVPLVPDDAGYSFMDQDKVKMRFTEAKDYVINDRSTRLGFLRGVLDYAYIEVDLMGIKTPRSFSVKFYMEESADLFSFLMRSLGCLTDIFASGNIFIVQTRDYLYGKRSAEVDINIVHLEKGKYYGFQLDGNHKYLLKDFYVTHNTTLMENFSYYRKHLYPVGRIFMGTEDGYKRFCKIFHPLFVSNYWDEKEEEKHVLRQRTCEMENGRGYAGNYAVNIVDDMGDDPKIYHKKLMKGLFKLGSQHWAQMFMVGSQYAIDLPPDIRKSVSYVAIGREPEITEREKLYKNFGGLTGSFDRFCDLMDALTGDHTFLIIKKRSQSNELEHCVSYFQTKILPQWTFGCKEYRDWAERRYDPNYVETVVMDYK